WPRSTTAPSANTPARNGWTSRWPRPPPRPPPRRRRAPRRKTPTWPPDAPGRTENYLLRNKEQCGIINTQKGYCDKRLAFSDDFYLAKKKSRKAKTVTWPSGGFCVSL